MTQPSKLNMQILCFTMHVFTKAEDVKSKKVDWHMCSSKMFYEAIPKSIPRLTTMIAQVNAPLQNIATNTYSYHVLQYTLTRANLQFDLHVVPQIQVDLALLRRVGWNGSGREVAFCIQTLVRIWNMDKAMGRKGNLKCWYIEAKLRNHSEPSSVK